jgi:capsular polysaccharide transport system permease protein
MNNKNKIEENDPVVKHFQEIDKVDQQSSSRKFIDNVKDFIKRITFGYTTTPGILEGHTYQRSKISIYKNKILFFSVILPNILSFLYFGFIASDTFVTESRFVVKNSQNNQALPLNGISQVIFGQSPTDSFSVQEYILSRDALDILVNDLNVKEEFSKNNIDFIGRFPGIKFWDKSFENFYSYYQTKTKVIVDTATSITTLNIYSYDKDLSFKINESLLKQSEALVNKLNDRVRSDLIKSSQSEVEIAKNKIQELTIKINSLKNKKIIKDPDKHISELQNLYLEKGFADRQVQAALTSLEMARAEAAKKQIYIEKISNPQIPDNPIEPKRLQIILGIFVTTLIIWGVLSLMISGVKEHYS